MGTLGLVQPPTPFFFLDFVIYIYNPFVLSLTFLNFFIKLCMCHLLMGYDVATP
jgi:hypothetical protein